MAGIDLTVAHAAFHVGLRLNQIRWHAEIACLFGGADLALTQGLLGRLRSEVTSLLPQADRRRIDEAIEQASLRLPLVLQSEQFAETITAAEGFLQNRNDPRPPQEIRQEAYTAVFSYIGFLCTDLLGDIEDAVEEPARRWLVLGRRLDEGIRFSVAEGAARSAPAGYLAGAMPQPGALPVPSGWRQTVWAAWQAVLATVTIHTFGNALPEARWTTDTPADLIAAIDAEFVRFTPQAAAARPQLTETEELLLEAMHDLQAFDADHLQSFAVIVRGAIDEQADYNNYKEYGAGLKRKRLVDSKRGAAGGYWLTTLGKAVVESLRNQ